MISEDPTIPANVPSPPRFRWTRRIFAGCLCILLMIAAAWGLWWKIAANRLQREINTIANNGGWISLEQLNAPEIPDAENAAEYLTAAGAARSANVFSPRSTELEYPPYLPMSAHWMQLSAAARLANAKALSLARQARQFTRVDWKVRFASAAFNVLLPGLNDNRELANLLADVALYEHLTGNDTEAMERLLDLLHEARAVDEQPIVVTHLVAGGIFMIGIETAIIIAPGLRLSDDPAPAPTTQPSSPARRQQVQDVIRLLLERTQWNGMSRILQCERLMVLDVEWMMRDTVLLKPMYRLDMARSLMEMQPMLAAAEQKNFQAIRHVPATPRPAEPSWTRVMTSGLFPASYNRAMETEFRARAEAAMAAVVLAARLYQVDHQGQWPTTLNALVPRYLPDVPVDPMSATATPLGYVILDNGLRPVVYSVGPDGLDDTASRNASPSMLPKVNFEPTADQWRDVSRITPPTTQPNTKEPAE